MKFQTYGCSYTEYFWPTWVNFLQTTHKVDRYGSPGIGNTRISQLILDNADKTCAQIVMWSGFDRVDRDDNKYIETNMGSGKYMGIYITLETLMANTIEAIYKTNKFCEDNDISIFNFLAFPLELGENKSTVKIQHHLYESLPKFSESLSMFCIDNPKKYSVEDNHPSPIQHYQYLNTVMLPLIGIDCIDINNQTLEDIEKKFTSLTKVDKWKKFEKQNFNL